ncbi:hypothetical protein ACFOSV_13320 [Algoriphagus namhaensis]|uniref:Uncharacterized protein n=1 Tax=Algoriphagus namhaensis TaxID=915353 RepID=A0ABV8AU60_9BACT
METYQKEGITVIRTLELKEQDVVITYEINASALWNATDLGKSEIEAFYNIINSTHTWGSGKDFETDAWVGSFVTWKLVVVGNDGYDYALEIDEIEFKEGESPFRRHTIRGKSRSRLRKKVRNHNPSVPDPEYSLSFFLIQERTGDTVGGKKRFTIDPKIRLRNIHI